MTYKIALTTTGGRALKFFASQRLEVRKTTSVKEGVEIRGNRVKVKVVKNKMAAPFREVEFELRFGRGIDRLGELIDAGAELGILQKSGSWFSYGKHRLGQGRDQAPILRRAIEEAILSKMGLDYLDAGTQTQRIRPSSETQVSRMAASV